MTLSSVLWEPSLEWIQGPGSSHRLSAWLSHSTDPPRQPTLTAHLELDAAGVEAGRRGLLLCRVDSDPPAQLWLLHEDRVVATSSRSSCRTCGGCSPRTKVTSTPNLLRVEIYNPVLEDEGVYQCEASNSLGNASASATFNAQGEGQGQVEGAGPSFWSLSGAAGVARVRAISREPVLPALQPPSWSSPHPPRCRKAQRPT